MPLSFTRDADIEAMFADSPHIITIGEVSGPCWFDEFDHQLVEGRDEPLISRARKATVQTSVFPGVAIGDEVTIEDEADQEQDYIVLNRVRLDDGALTDLFLRPVTDDES
jgi:hypothetical protein